MSQLIPSTEPFRVFKDNTNTIHAIAVFPDRKRMVTGSADKMLRLWDLKTGVLLKKMKGHRANVLGLAVSRNGQIIASGDEKGELIAWHGDTGESLTQAIKAHSRPIYALDFYPDGTVLATGSPDKTTKLWNTKTWKQQAFSIRREVNCVQYSPSGELLAIATDSNIEIYNSSTRAPVAKFKAHTQWNFSLAWMPDGSRLLSSGDDADPSIREWDTSTWKQVGDPWIGHTCKVNSIAIHPAGTLVASASPDEQVRLWRHSDQQNISIFQHSSWAECVTFSRDGNHVLSGGGDEMVSEWKVPKEARPEEAPETKASKAQDSDLKILTITTTACKACISGDLSAAEKILTQEISTDANNDTSYANRSLVMARKLDWDRALCDANKSINIRPSLSGYLAKGIALCGKQQIWDATIAFGLASTFTHGPGDSKTSFFLSLIEAIAYFNANKHEEAMLLVQGLAARPNPDPLAARVVEAYLQVQLGTTATNGALHKEAATHFTAAVNTGAFFATLDIHSMYEDFVMLFGWDLKSLWQTANQQRYHALVRSGKTGAALEAYRYMMDMSDETTKAIFVAWTNTLDDE